MRRGRERGKKNTWGERYQRVKWICLHLLILVLLPLLLAFSLFFFAGNALTFSFGCTVSGCVLELRRLYFGPSVDVDDPESRADSMFAVACLFSRKPDDRRCSDRKPDEEVVIAGERGRYTGTSLFFLRPRTRG